MTLDSDTTVERLSGGNYEVYYADLAFSTFASPEAYDPTVPPGTTAGDKYVDNLLGISVEGVNADVDITYDEANRQFRALNKDGTAFTGSVTVRVAIKGDPSA